MYVQKFLKPLYLGEVEEYTHGELFDDFTALTEKAKEMVKLIEHDRMPRREKTYHPCFRYVPSQTGLYSNIRLQEA